MSKKRIIIIVAIVAAAIIALALLVPRVSTQPAEQPKESASAAVEQTEIPAGNETPAQQSDSANPTATKKVKIEVAEDMSEETVQYKNNTVEYTYYDVAEDTDKKLTVEAPVQSDLKYGLEVVAQQMFDQSLEKSPLRTNSIALEGGKLRIDFTSAIYDDVNFGTAGEAGMLDNIANAYLNNLPEVTAVYYSVDGNNYSTGHFELPANVAYKEK